MKPADLPREVKCALALHEMLRRMGFSPEEIFVAPHPPPHALQVVIQAQGKEFRVNVGAMTLSVEKFVELWPRPGRGRRAAAMIVKILAFQNGNLACFDEDLEQVAEEQSARLPPYPQPGVAKALRTELRAKLARGVVSAETELRTQWDDATTTVGAYLDSDAAPAAAGGPQHAP